MKNLTLRQLNVFVALTEGEDASFSAAAAKLGISQPAVSMLMRQLEADAGVPLLVRQGRRTRLTRAGTILLRSARIIIEQVLIAEESLASAAGGGLGHLRLGVVPTANYFAPRLLMEFQRQMPGMTFALSVGRRDEILAMLDDHRIDIAIAGHPPGEANVEVDAFARHPHCIVAAPDNRLAGLEHVTWEQLRDEPFIFREAGSATRQFLEHLLQARSVQVSVRFELAGNETIKQAVMSGMGISFMSGQAIQVEVEARRIAILRVDGMPTWLDWCLLRRRERQPAALVTAFRDYVLGEGPRVASCQPWIEN
jgi:DNA-binding transcriptional LysR family regulator